METTIPFTRQQRITNTLLLNASFIDNLGLMHGKMGIAIYFFHLARETKNQIYEDYAGELIDEIYDEITIKTPCGFENGLAGIGWGIEYLVQNGFIEADTDEVLEEFDKRIIHEITYHAPEDIGILRGMSGYIAYFTKRIKKGSKKNPTLKRALFKAILLLQKYIDRTDLDFNELWREPKKFDITWNYTSVLWTLTESIRSGLYKKEIGQIIKRLISPLEYNVSLPQLHSHRLLLALSIKQLNQLNFDIYSDSYLRELAFQLIKGINNDKIQEELETNSGFLQHGASGVSFVFPKLFQLTQSHPTVYEVFKNTMETFGLVAKHYVKNNYDVVIHLPIEFAFTPDGHRPVKEKFRSESENLLLHTYHEWYIKPMIVNGRLEQRLQKIIETLNLPQQMSIKEAIDLAMHDKIKKFDSVKLEAILL